MGLALVGALLCGLGLVPVAPAPVVVAGVRSTAVTSPAVAGRPLVARAGARPGEAAAPGQGYRFPLPAQPRVTRPFDPPARRWLPGHRGVDLAAPDGAVVRAAGAGVVRFAGEVAGRPVVSIDHADGLRTTYEPVSPTVAAGDRVSAGDPIGVLLPTHAGCPVAACLHWGLRSGALYLDPLILLGLGPVRLLPD